MSLRQVLDRNRRVAIILVEKPSPRAIDLIVLCVVPDEDHTPFVTCLLRYGTQMVDMTWHQDLQRALDDYRNYRAPHAGGEAAWKLAQHRNAYRRGRSAATLGYARQAPYQDRRRNSGGMQTFTTAYHNAWLAGYDDMLAEKDAASFELPDVTE